MTINEFQQIIEIIASVLVVPSLIYLAIQVRQNTKQMRANTSFQWIEASGQMNALVAGDTSTASVFRRGWEDPTLLSEDEQTQFVVHLGQFMQIYSTMFEQYQAGLLPKTQWHNCRKDIISVMNSPGGVFVWDNFGSQGLDSSFVEYVEDLRSKNESSFDLSKFENTK